MMEKNKRTIVQFVICMGLVVLIWCGYFFVKCYGVDKKIEVIDDDFSWMYQVESAKIEGEELVVRGFAFELDRDSKEKAFEIVLREVGTEKNIFLKNNYLEREDVNDYFLCQYDYSKSGFEAKIDEKQLDLYEKEYEMLLRVKGEKRTYHTGMYLVQGELLKGNPQLVASLSVEGTLLEEVIEKGKMQVARPDLGIYVYQYQNDLYWIADSSYQFDSQGSTSMVYMVYTSGAEHLPAESVKNGWECDRRNFHFEVCELEIDTDAYRVAKVELPKEYPVVKIVMGYYTTEWVWRETHRPYYEFRFN